MSDFEFLPPVGSSSKKSTSPAPENNNAGEGEADLNFEFLPQSSSQNNQQPPKKDQTGQDLSKAAGVLTGAVASRKLDPQSPANIASRNSSMAASTAPMEYERSGLQRYLNSQLSPNLKISLGELEQKLGGAKIRTPSDVQNALKAIQEVKIERVAKVDPSTGMPRKIYTMEAGRPAVDLSEFERKPGFLNRAADELSDLGNMAKGKLSSVGKVGLGGFGGAVAGSQLYDAVDQYQKEGAGLHMPSMRNAAQFASGIGGALGSVPTGITQAAGLALQVPALGYQAMDYAKEMNERRKNATKEDTNRMLTNVDIMGNPIP
jgi:hypothetical protein